MGLLQKLAFEGLLNKFAFKFTFGAITSAPRRV